MYKYLFSYNQYKNIKMLLLLLFFFFSSSSSPLYNQYIPLQFYCVHFISTLFSTPLLLYFPTSLFFSFVHLLYCTVLYSTSTFPLKKRAHYFTSLTSPLHSLVTLLFTLLLLHTNALNILKSTKWRGD